MRTIRAAAIILILGLTIATPQPFGCCCCRTQPAQVFASVALNRDALVAQPALQGKLTSRPFVAARNDPRISPPSGAPIPLRI